MSKDSEKTIIQIEETQAALRASIEEAKDLTSKSQRLISKLRDQTSEGDKPKPAK